MSETLQTFLASATRKAAANVLTAIGNLPVDKRNWQPAAGARSAMDQLAECALNNGYVADLVETRRWAAPERSVYDQLKQDLVASGLEAVKELLDKNTERLVGVILGLPDDQLPVEVGMPWGSGTLDGVIAYPYWNMGYHEGQINYIGSILGL